MKFLAIEQHLADISSVFFFYFSKLASAEREKKNQKERNAV
jgi:hypothetical protein